MKQTRRFIALTRCDGACCRGAGCPCRARFRYGSDGQRTRSWGADGARVYLPGYEHRTDTGETKVYVGDYAVISRAGATRKVEYLLKDRLGSVDAVANSSGTVTETRGYDAFGKPRDGSWNDLTPAKIASTAVTPKGFTRHEHLNQLELIHMNGRAYDYQLGRFTGVDPFIQFPLNSQSLNPYSYILNNPLSGTDPTGYQSRGSVCAIGTSGNANGCISGAGSDIPTGTEKINKPGKPSENDRGKHPTTNSGNGGGNTQGTTGSGGRKDQTANASEKSTATDSSDNEEIVGSRQHEVNSVSRAPGVKGGGKRVVNPSPEAKRAFALLEAALSKSSFDNADQAIDAFEKAFLPFTERYGVEVGANIDKQGDYWVRDITLGNSHEVDVPISGLTVFFVHTHPKGSRDGLSGYVALHRGVITAYDDAGHAYEIAQRSSQFRGAYAIRAGDGARWYFDYSAFNKALRKEREKGGVGYLLSDGFVRRVK